MRLHWVFASWFGSGFSPLASGTVGTAAALPLVWALSLLPPLGAWNPWCLACAALFFYPAVLSASAVEKEVGRHDPGVVVVDEVIGTLLTFAFLPQAALASFAVYAAGAFLFRLFDVWKPWVIGYSQALPRGWGIVMDDVLGGIVAGLILWGCAPWLMTL